MLRIIFNLIFSFILLFGVSLKAEINRPQDFIRDYYQFIATVDEDLSFSVFEKRLNSWLKKNKYEISGDGKANIAMLMNQK